MGSRFPEGFVKASGSLLAGGKRSAPSGRTGDEEHREEPLLNLRILAKRAVLMQCLLIVLDRPTRGLDENGCKELPGDPTGPCKSRNGGRCIGYQETESERPLQ